MRSEKLIRGIRGRIRKRIFFFKEHDPQEAKQIVFEEKKDLNEVCNVCILCIRMNEILSTA